MDDFVGQGIAVVVSEVPVVVDLATIVLLVDVDLYLQFQNIVGNQDNAILS